MQQTAQLTYGLPAFDVVPDLLARVKSALRLSGTSADAKLTDYIRVSLDIIGRYTNRILVQTEVTGRFDHAAPSSLSCHPALYFAVAPVYRDAFVSLTWLADESLTGFATPYLDQGFVFMTQEPANAALGWSACCTVDGVQEPYPITAVINAGYPLIDDVWSCPPALQQAVVSMASYFYEHPSDCGECGCSAGSASNGVRLPPSVAILISMYVI
ncbi:MAG: hypothetical protein ACEQSD_09240, partial [Flavobacteriales bacterium]